MKNPDRSSSRVRKRLAVGNYRAFHAPACRQAGLDGLWFRPGDWFPLGQRCPASQAPEIGPFFQPNQPITTILMIGCAVAFDYDAACFHCSSFKTGILLPGGSAFFLNLGWDTRGYVELLAPSARSILTLSAWPWLKSQIQLAHEQNKWGQVKWLFPAAVRPSKPTVTPHLIPFAPNSLHSRARQWLDHPQ